MTLDEALTALGEHHHHGAAMWIFDVRIMRAMPYGWEPEHGALPMLTAFEARAIAAALVRLCCCLACVGRIVVEVRHQVTSA